MCMLNKYMAKHIVNIFGKMYLDNYHSNKNIFKKKIINEIYLKLNNEFKINLGHLQIIISSIAKFFNGWWLHINRRNFDHTVSHSIVIPFGSTVMNVTCYVRIDSIDLNNDHTFIHIIIIIITIGHSCLFEANYLTKYLKWNSVFLFTS